MPLRALLRSSTGRAAAYVAAALVAGGPGSAAAPAAPAAPARGRVAHRQSFRTPSGNIGCTVIATSRTLGPGSARCDIRHRTYRLPPRPRSCPRIVDYGQGLVVGATGRGRVVCAGDTAADPRAPVLPYGAVDAVGEFRCAVTTSAVTCLSARTGHGFAIAVARYRLF